MLSLLKRNKYLILILLISILVFHRWLNLSIFAYSDWLFSFKETMKEFLIPSVWSTRYYGFGSADPVLWKFPLNFFYGIFGNMNLDFNFADKFLIFWPTIILSGIFSFLLVKKIVKSDLGALVGSFVFSYNTYFLSINTQGHELLTIAFIFAILAIWLFIKTLEERKISLAIYTSLILFIVGSYDFRSLYITIWILFFYYLYFLFILNKLSNLKRSFKKGSFAFIILILLVILNFYWIYTSYHTGNLIDNTGMGRELFGNNYWNLSQAFTLFYPFWNGKQPEWFVVHSIPFYFWLIPIFAFLGLLFNRKNKNVLFFGFVSLIGIILTKQIAQPLSNLYLWLYQHLLGFSAFREASKFYFIIALGYSVLIGSFIAFILQNWIKSKLKIFSKYFLTILIIFLFLWNTKPLISGEIGSLFIPRQIPGDYLVFKDFILKQDGFFRTFWTPTYSSWSIFTKQKPEVSNVVVMGGEWKKNVSLNTEYINLPINEQITEVFKIKGANFLFDISSIKYVIVPIRDFANDNDFFIYYGGEEKTNIRGWYISELDNVEWLKKIDIGTDDLVIYENENFKPHIYMTKEQETIYQELPYEKVAFEQKNPSEYKIHLKNVSSSFYLNFSESYHSDWDLKIGNFNWSSAILEKNYFLESENHMKNNAGLNSFYIDLSSISKNNYTKNRDGSYNVDLTLYFKPQSYFYIGLIVSGLTLIVMAGYLVYDFKKRKKLQNKEINKSEKII